MLSKYLSHITHVENNMITLEEPCNGHKLEIIVPHEYRGKIDYFKYDGLFSENVLNIKVCDYVVADYVNNIIYLIELKNTSVKNNKNHVKKAREQLKHSFLFISPFFHILQNIDDDFSSMNPVIKKCVCTSNVRRTTRSKSVTVSDDLIRISSNKIRIDDLSNQN